MQPTGHCATTLTPFPSPHPPMFRIHLRDSRKRPLTPGERSGETRAAGESKKLLGPGYLILETIKGSIREGLCLPGELISAARSNSGSGSLSRGVSIVCRTSTDGTCVHACADRRSFIVFLGGTGAVPKAWIPTSKRKARRSLPAPRVRRRLRHRYARGRSSRRAFVGKCARGSSIAAPLYLLWNASRMPLARDHIPSRLCPPGP